MWLKTSLQIVGAALVVTMVGGMLFADQLNGDAEEYSRLTTEFVFVHNRAEDVRAQRDRLQSEFGALERSDQAFLEKIIREDYGYVKKNETVLHFTDARQPR